MDDFGPNEDDQVGPVFVALPGREEIAKERDPLQKRDAVCGNIIRVLGDAADDCGLAASDFHIGRGRPGKIIAGRGNADSLIDTYNFWVKKGLAPRPLDVPPSPFDNK
jgi:hypothetical protein